jgi:hypothetical protein
MENLNFLPQSIERKYFANKIRAYKLVVLALWICCLILFIIYNFYFNKNAIQNSVTYSSTELTGKSALDSTPARNIISIGTFNKFIMNLEADIPYSVLSIDGKKISLEISVNSKDQYYRIVELIENKPGCRVLHLSSPEENNGFFEFRIIVEVV